MSLTGVEVPASTLSNIGPNTVLVVISDDKGTVRVAQVDHQSIAKGEPFLKITASSLSGTVQPQSGCWKRINGNLIWVDPCV